MDEMILQFISKKSKARQAVSIRQYRTIGDRRRNLFFIKPDIAKSTKCHAKQTIVQMLEQNG